MNIIGQYACLAVRPGSADSMTDFPTIGKTRVSFDVGGDEKLSRIVFWFFWRGCDGWFSFFVVVFAGRWRGRIGVKVIFGKWGGRGKRRGLDGVFIGWLGVGLQKIIGIKRDRAGTHTTAVGWDNFFYEIKIP